MTGHLAWAVFVDYHHENLWRETLGQADIDAWCAAHGWDSRDVVSGSVSVYAYNNGHVEVTADFMVRGADGLPQFDVGQDRVKTRRVTAPLARSLPEGIGDPIR